MIVKMRYNNKAYTIKSTNLNNSLVFYHALFNRMPEELNTDAMLFRLKELTLAVQETTSVQPSSSPLTFNIAQNSELNAANDRMRRFRTIAQINGECQVLNKAFGIIDPDGNKWVIGDPDQEVRFEECYVEN